MTHSFVFKVPSEYKNPLPKLKMTGRQHWMPQARRYVAYKADLVAAFFDSLPDIPWKRECALNAATGEKPITIGHKARMDIFITWASGAHGDPENIFGAIADALFQNDKMLAGSMDFDTVHRGAGEVRISIEI